MQNLGVNVTYSDFIFNLYTYEAPYFEKAGLYCVGYISNDLKQFTLKYFGKTDDLSERGMDNHHKKNDFNKQACNCIGFIEIENEKYRSEIEEYLIRTHKPLLNEKFT